MTMHAIRKKRITFYIALTLLCMAIIMLVIHINSRPRTQPAMFPIYFDYTLILDAGHGGLDGGAVDNGYTEAPINLEITEKTRDLLRFMGISALMTREDEGSLDFDPEASVRENKNSDLRARLKMADSNATYDFLSIHLNKFGQSKYSGAQVFYSTNNAASQQLALLLQDRMRYVLAPDNTREAKQSPDGVYLMQEVTAPAVTIECGFLSNPGEASQLADDDYQKKIAVAIALGYIDFIGGAGE